MRILLALTRLLWGRLFPSKMIEWCYWYDAEAYILYGPYETCEERDECREKLVRQLRCPGFYWMDVSDRPHGPFHGQEEAAADEEDWDALPRIHYWWDQVGAPHGPFETLDECREKGFVEAGLAAAVEDAMIGV